MPNSMLLDELTELVRLETPFTFVKKGDGELECMHGVQGGNCDGHPYSKELGERLKQAFTFLEDKAFIVEFGDQRNYNSLLHRTDCDLQKVKDFWMSVRNSNKEKIFIGPERLRRVSGLLHARYFPIPLVNAFQHYAEMWNALQEIISPDAIVILCAGMPAKVFIHDLLVKYPNLTCLDAGSAFDPLIVGPTRTVQASKEVLEALYADVL